MKKNVFLLGATGSIGTQVLEVLREQKDFCLKTISVGKNIPLAEAIITEFSPRFVSCINKDDMVSLKQKFADTEFGYGNEGLIKAATYSEEDGMVINSVVGMVGLLPTIEAIKKRRTILLANKETLVVAGSIIKKLIKEYNVELIPIDSEHSAVFQCLKTGNRLDVSKLIITASGGSFRKKTREELKNVTVKEALHHPNWKMGAKITIDSATMVNKGLEVIEAHHLFDIEYDNIETVLHPESIIHSMVEYRDASVIAQLSYPDMRVPIQYALTYPDKRFNRNFKQLDLTLIRSLTFLPMDFERFPLLKLAYEVGKTGGIMPAVYNAANEAAVGLFLNGKIDFLEIENIIFRETARFQNITDPSLEAILSADGLVKDRIRKQYEVK